MVWNRHQNNDMKNLIMFTNDVDKCVYSRSENGECVIICLYVDDMLIFYTCDDIVFKTKAFFGSKF